MTLRLAVGLIVAILACVPHETPFDLQTIGLVPCDVSSYPVLVVYHCDADPFATCGGAAGQAPLTGCYLETLEAVCVASCPP